jgi:FKBP-type peptidyl-prolyl cis-trans isomerase
MTTLTMMKIRSIFMAITLVLAPALEGDIMAASENGPDGNEITTSSGLMYIDQTVGTGDVAVAGKSVTVHYTGWLTNGQKFDSSVDRGQPFTFPLGAGRVIKGWDEGVQGMKVGGKRKLTIPSQLGYGARGAGGAIPPHATLVFDVELLGIR